MKLGFDSYYGSKEYSIMILLLITKTETDDFLPMFDDFDFF
jgi:hypothetical protein